MENQEQEQEAQKFVLVGFNPIVVTGTEIKGGVSTAVSSDGKKFSLCNVVKEHEECYSEWWEDNDGHMYFELSLYG